MKTLTLTINEQTKEGVSLLAFLKSLDFVKVQETDSVSSGKKAAVECDAVPLENFISELHSKVDQHFASSK